MANNPDWPMVGNRPMSGVEAVRIAWPLHRQEAEEAYTLFAAYAPIRPRIPGMDTVLRMALRIWRGKSIEEAAAKEYVYRWEIALMDGADEAYLEQPSRWRQAHAPHLLGM